MPQQVLVLGDEDLIESLQSAGMPGGAVDLTRVRALDDLLASLDESWDALLIVWDGVPDPKEESFRALAAQTDVPIVVLADQPDVDLVVDILDWGGDECLPRELSPREIVTHLRAQIRRVTDYSQPLAEATRLEGLPVWLPKTRVARACHWRGTATTVRSTTRAAAPALQATRRFQLLLRSAVISLSWTSYMR